MGGRKRHPPAGDLLPAAIGVEQQVAIAALHHANAEADETDRAATWICHWGLGCRLTGSHLSGMSSDQNQHYLPQSYQRGWSASGRPYVYRWAYNKLVCEPKAPKSTGARDGLYFIPMAPQGEQNMMEEVFWKKIDQWGADGLMLLRANNPAAAKQINKERLATFVMSFLFRNPNQVKYFNAWANDNVLNACPKDYYPRYRRPHEPATFEEFKAALEQPGMTELGAQLLRNQVENKNIRNVILDMEWQVVTVPTTSDPILTSDVPLIVHRALKDDDGCLILPLSNNEFFVAYNLGRIDMKKRISDSLASGRFVRSMNKYVVEHRIDYVYGVNDSLLAFVAKHWGISEAPYFPSLTMPPPRP
jgi:Protein of unknown function (DUF4238)